MARNTEILVRETSRLKWTRIDGLSKGSRTYSEYRFYLIMPTGHPALLVHTMRAGGDASREKAKRWFIAKQMDLVASDAQADA